MVDRLIVHRVAQPGVDRGLPPAGAAFADLHVLRESPVLHFAIEGRATEPGAVKHGIEAEDTIGGIGGHGMILDLTRFNRPSPVFKTLVFLSRAC